MDTIQRCQIARHASVQQWLEDDDECSYCNIIESTIEYNTTAWKSCVRVMCVMCVRVLTQPTLHVVRTLLYIFWENEGKERRMCYAFMCNAGCVAFFDVGFVPLVVRMYAIHSWVVCLPFEYRISSRNPSNSKVCARYSSGLIGEQNVHFVLGIRNVFEVLLKSDPEHYLKNVGYNLVTFSYKITEINVWFL